MDNAHRDVYDEDALEYFLLNGTAAAGLYVPDGVISTSGFEFTYPSLCMVDYQSPSGSFTIETATTENGVEYNNVSYNGMGLRSAENAGYYLLFTYDITSESVWYYVSNYIDYFTIPNTENFDIDDYDFEGYLNCLFLGSKTSYILAVTTDAPSDTTLSNYVNYIGGNILEKSNAVVYDETQASPYAVTVTPDALRFYIGSSYNVTITFSDELVKEDSTKEVTLRYTVGSGVTLNSANTVISNFKWSESTPNQISFTFTPDKNYSADRCDYTFTLENLVGKTSGKAPVDTILFAMYKPSFSCPVNPLSYCTAVASVPQLISDSDLSVNGWHYTDENGNEQTVSGNSLSNKISLVATTYSEDENKEYENEVNAYNEDNGDNVNILSSATYDLSLNLCDMQVKYLNGEKVMIMVPFPEGYSADSAGVSFKAYHFADDGSVEEIDCYCTEYGIILFCSSFSDYTVAAVESDGTDVKTVLIAAEGNGTASSASGEKFIKVEKDGKLSVTISADSDYCIDSISVNGKI
ncbi:MAG: hypothetical protein LUD27_02240, partial [Clostridia bacterium]|nr:hypothetical protein [Clostridia bacterium]